MANFGARFQLFLFHRTIACDQACLAAGVDGLVIDLETRGKAARQSHFDTEINTHSLEDLRRVKGELGAYVICRCNPPGSMLEQEVEGVLRERADEILVPLIRTAEEAEKVVDLVHGRCKIGLMIETAEALEIVQRLGRLPIHRLYVGLNDLRISRGSPSIFVPLIDGSLERCKSDAGDTDFGFAGLTLPGLGCPLPTQHLIDEMARLRCSFSFLRRSFYRDIVRRSPETEIPRLRQSLHQAGLRPVGKVREDRTRLEHAVSRLIRE
jgi:hypothetical protein